MPKCIWTIRLLCLVSFAAGAYAQSGNATLNGTVADATGAVVPNVHVKVTNTATGVSRIVDTTSAGLYVVTPLIPGDYKIETTAAGFKTEVVNDVKLVIDEVARVDIKLEVGSASQTMTVTGEAVALLQTTESSVGFVVQSQQVTELPLNGRYFTQLLQLSPGANANGFQRNQMPAFTVNGVDNLSIYYRLDGIENNEREFGGANIPISVDAIQEVKVQTANFSAEYGRSPIQVDVAVKSGSNQMHGTAFEFIRNQDLDSPVWTFNGPHTRNQLKRNQFGGMLGGPIKKDKLFYLFSYDGTRERFSQPQTLTVPTNDMRNGVFPAGTIVFDPLAQTPFPNNTIPQSRWNSISTKVLPYLPSSNLVGLANRNGTGLALAPSNNYYYNPFRDQNINQYTGRVDYAQSEKNSFFGRYTYSSNLLIGEGPLATNVQSAVNGVEDAHIGGQNVSGAWTRNISPRTLNELRGGVSTDPQNYAHGDNTDYAAQFGIKQFLEPNSYTGFPHFTVSGINLGSGEYRPLKVGEKNFQVSDTMTLIRGSHNLRIGGDVRRTLLNTTNNQLSTGRFSFTGVQTRDRAHPAGTTTCPGGTSATACGAGDGTADFLLGYPSQVADGTPIPPVSKYFSNWAGFVNDTWNVSKSLTLTIGLRYEYQTRFHTSPYFYTDPVIANNEFTGKIALATGPNGALPNLSGSALAQEPAGTVVSCLSVGLPDNCLVSQKNQWQPRLGFAYRLGDKTVVRAGAGIFTGSFYGDFDTESCESWPLVITQISQSYTTPPSGTALPPLSLNNPFNGTNPAAPSYANCAPPARKLPASYQWNFSAERTLGNNTVLTLSYVGNGGRHLDSGTGISKVEVYNVPSPWGVVLNPGQTQTRAVPTFGAVDQHNTIDSSSYNALQVKVEHRLSHGLFFSAAYSYSKAIIVQNWLGDPRDAKLDRGPANFDIRDALTFSPIYTLPVGRGQRFANNNKVLDGIVGGWQLSGIMTYRTGLPFTPTLSGIDELQLGGLNGQNRPDRTCSGNLFNPTATQWFNPACFTVPVEPTTPGALLREGNSGVNILNGPHWFSFDAGIAKNFHVTERVGLEFRTEMFNALNHPILALPASALNLFATATPQTRITATAANTFPRIIQFGLKLRF